MRQAALDIQLAAAACEIARNAGKAILEVYAHADTIAGKNIAHKADSSPLTEADLRAHHVIAGALQLLLLTFPLFRRRTRHPTRTEPRAASFGLLIRLMAQRNSSRAMDSSP